MKFCTLGFLFLTVAASAAEEPSDHAVQLSESYNTPALVSHDDERILYTNNDNPNLQSTQRENIQRDFGNILESMTQIAKGNLTNELNTKLLKQLDTAWGHGLNQLEEGRTFVNMTQNILRGKGQGKGSKKGSGSKDKSKKDSSGKGKAKKGIEIANKIHEMVQKLLKHFDKTPKICRRVAYDRSVGSVLTPQCLEGEEVWGGLCYPKCKPGYENIACCTCRKKGCDRSGVTDIGVSCAKPAAYGRGVGYSIWDQIKCNSENKQGCELFGWIWYPKCASGFHNVGCCICSPDCPAGYRDDGAFCAKDSYGRGVGRSRLGCSPGMEQYGALCYEPCRTGFYGVGPFCWGSCPNDIPTGCGLYCSSTAVTCASTTIEISYNSVKSIISAFFGDVKGAGDAVIKVGGKLFNVSDCKY